LRTNVLYFYIFRPDYNPSFDLTKMYESALFLGKKLTSD